MLTMVALGLLTLWGIHPVLSGAYPEIIGMECHEAALYHYDRGYSRVPLGEALDSCSRGEPGDCVRAARADYSRHGDLVELRADLSDCEQVKP